MALERGQYGILHIAKKQLSLSDDAYRTVLRSTAHVHSAKQLNNLTFEDVMAVLERQGFVDSRNGTGYWQGKVERRGTGVVNERAVYLIRLLARKCRYCLPALCEQFSDNRTMYPEKMTSGEGWKLTEMLKAVVKREEQKSHSSHQVTEDNRAQPQLPF